MRRRDFLCAATAAAAAAGSRTAIATTPEESTNLERLAWAHAAAEAVESVVSGECRIDLHYVTGDEHVRVEVWELNRRRMCRVRRLRRGETPFSVKRVTLSYWMPRCDGVRQLSLSRFTGDLEADRAVVFQGKSEALRLSPVQEPRVPNSTAASVNTGLLTEHADALTLGDVLLPAR